MFGFRKRRLPAGQRPKLARDEHILAWALTSEGTAVIATNRNLWTAGGSTAWNHLSKAVWDGVALTVTPSTIVEERDGYSVIADEEPVRLTLPDPDNVPQVVRQRVTASVRHPARHELPEGGLWLAARRVPGHDGLAWIVRYDQGVDSDSEGLRAATDDLVRETQSKVVALG